MFAIIMSRVSANSRPTVLFSILSSVLIRFHLFLINRIQFDLIINIVTIVFVLYQLSLSIQKLKSVKPLHACEVACKA
jgi:hypothetical protein